jgi:cytochrome c peroxidase
VIARAAAAAVATFMSAAAFAQIPPWEEDNPLRPVPRPPRGITTTFDELHEPPTPERVRLGRWLFYDKRLSADGTVACASCHQSDHAFSQSTPVPTGIHGQKGRRKAPSFINLAWTLYPHFFWDGRAGSLEEQALSAIANPTEMDLAPARLAARVGRIPGYRPYFAETFGTAEVTAPRIARAIADYVRTRMSGNSRWDRWTEENAIVNKTRRGEVLFFGKARCNQCHLGQNFTDSRFHNTGIGWDAKGGGFSDTGRFAVTKVEADHGAFKTPTLREVSRHAPYMHDGSVPTLRDVVLHYDRGGNPNPHLDPKIEPLHLTQAEVATLVDFLEGLAGEGWADTAPATFPR